MSALRSVASVRAGDDDRAQRQVDISFPQSEELATADSSYTSRESGVTGTAVRRQHRRDHRRRAASTPGDAHDRLAKLPDPRPETMKQPLLVPQGDHRID